jgi:8-oxo-(d)GTP phosphatase
MPGSPEIVAAGAVVLRKGPEVLLVHRPRYDDWSFPKGKLEPGEHVLAAAVREVAEETGLTVRLGPPLTTQRYAVRNGEARDKSVHYWTGRAVGEPDTSGFLANAEVDQVRWLPLLEARPLLSYPQDRCTLDEAEQVRRPTYPLVVLRHARARVRGSWKGRDRDRPLTKAGLFQAEQLVPLLRAYGVRRVLSSSSRRCLQTVSPYAAVAGVEVETTDELAQEEATAAGVSGEVQRLLALKEPSAVCTHRPLLPDVLAALGVPRRPLEPGALLVAHHRKGRVVTVEQHESAFR